MKNIISIVAITLVFSGLMIILPKPALAQAVIALDDQLEEYWLVEKKVAPKYPRNALLRGTMGCVAVGYIIQADGMTSNHTVLAFEPSNIFNKSAIKAAQQFKYTPSDQNPEKVPALTLNVFTYQITGDSHGRSKSGEDKQELLNEVCLEAGKKALEPADADAD